MSVVSARVGVPNGGDVRVGDAMIAGASGRLVDQEFHFVLKFKARTNSKVL